MASEKRAEQLETMQCDEVIAALEGYLAGTLPLSSLLSVAGHLESCLPCMHRLELRRAAFAVVVARGGNGDPRADADA